MTKTIRTSLLVLAFSAGILMLFGIGLERGSSLGLLDFKALYYGSRCLIQHCDPYDRTQLERLFVAEGGEHPSDPPQVRQVITQYVNLPTTFLITAWFGTLGWTVAHLLWTSLTVSCFLIAGLLMWKACKNSAPLLAACLIGFLVANSEVLVAGGNAAGLVVSLCVIGAWCLLENRLVPLGIAALAISLLIKPHDSGLVWLYFVLAGGSYRKQAWRTLAVASVLAIPAIVWVSNVAPHWPRELQANLAALSARGGFNDPGPSSYVARTAGDVIDLQAVVSMFRDDPRVYNTVAYGVCTALLLPWGWAAWRGVLPARRSWLGLAAVAAITMLVTYHKPVDARLLLLSVPACAMLWAEGGKTGMAALLVTSGAIASTSDLPLAVLTHWTRDFHVEPAGAAAQALTALVTRPTPLVLLVAALFYVWVWVRDVRGINAPASASPGDKPIGAYR
jgi:hypothetical protein